MTTNNTKNKKEKIINDEIHQEKEINLKKVFWLIVTICLLSVVLYVIVMAMCAYAIEELNIITVPVTLIILSTIAILIICFVCLYIEYKIFGYHICPRCQHEHAPTFNQLCWTPHFGWTRYMRCPKCGKWSWQKKSFK